MSATRRRHSPGFAVLLVAALCCARPGAAGEVTLGPEQIVPRGGFGDLQVPGYSIPHYADWNNDGKKDLIVGEGGGAVPGKIRVYLNVGQADAPMFVNNTYAQAAGSDIEWKSSGCGCDPIGCMGLFPRVVYWDDDDRKDLLVGQVEGSLWIYLGIGDDTNPTFGAGDGVMVGPPGSKEQIQLGGRVTIDVVDWNNDGAKDLVLGALDGKIRVYVNEGTDTAPDFLTEIVLQDASGGGDLVVPGLRSSPAVADLDGDGKKDLLAGNTNGELVFYSNQGTDAAPSFSAYAYLTADGVKIDLPGLPRSRPFVADWTGDGLPDVLVGADDGMVHLFQGVVPEPCTLALLAAGTGLLAAWTRRRRGRGQSQSNS